MYVVYSMFVYGLLRYFCLFCVLIYDVRIHYMEETNCENNDRIEACLSARHRLVCFVCDLLFIIFIHFACWLSRTNIKSVYIAYVHTYNMTSHHIWLGYFRNINNAMIEMWTHTQSHKIKTHRHCSATAARCLHAPHTTTHDINDIAARQTER